MRENLINLTYLFASLLFILGLKGLGHPRSAVKGNLLGAFGMFIAIAATLVDRRVLSFELIAFGLAIGSVLGTVMAIKVQMTAMPQLVALFNGLGGVASTFVAGAALYEAQQPSTQQQLLQAIGAGGGPELHFLVATVAAGIVGTVTFTGSVVAFAKLQEIFDWPGFTGVQVLNGLLVAASLGLGVWITVEPSALNVFWMLTLVAGTLGFFLVVPIGGADMPVVIALLNSYSGIAAAASGFVLQNNVLIISGALVGASGIILTQNMCKAMNRSLANVMFAKLGPKAGGSSADEVYGGRVKSTTAEEVAMILESASRVVIVPGYGLAVSQAQHAVRDLTQILEDRGVLVEFAIHPVAGRMPGHMNVLLAEAEIDYDKMKEMDEINPTFGQVDVALVIGANDVVNPLARTDPKSPIAGMPILDVDHARTVIIMKRSLSPGFAGIPNPLFAADNTLMFYGDGKKALLDLNAALKAL
ncbi:MAG: NAD(P)(+) transhydrogenase (Re/Si-specific) subunit beta [Deltaproteobacteria bacterium]|nr:NAD(P)(+) transhydrogenase (Re/Si-specific) subunit beta [Deltaproteobacteria bacterium]